MVKVVALDLDGVFFERPHQGLVKNIAKRFSLDEDFLKEVLFERAAKEGGYNDLKCGKIPSEQYWGWLFKTLDIEGKITKDDYLDELLKVYRINPKAVELIGSLHNQNIRTAVCSNNYKDNIDRLNKEFDLSKYFDIMVFSHEVRAMKPDTKIFKTLIERSRTEPSEIVYTDDKEENCLTARNLGMKAFVYTNLADFVKKLSDSGVNL